MEREDSIRGRKGKGGKGVLELQFFFVSWLDGSKDNFRDKIPFLFFFLLL